MAGQNNTQSSIPATLDWYRQGANWLVGLSTGAVAIGLTNLERIEGSEGHIKILCGLAGVFFLVSILSGILFYFWLSTLANGLESKERHSTSEATETDPTKKADLQGKVKRAEAKVTKARRWFPRFYWALIVTFPFGVILVSGAILATLARQKSDPPSYSIIAIPVASSSGGTPTAASVMRFEKKSGKAWIMIRDSAGQFKWREVGLESSTSQERQLPPKAVNKESGKSPTLVP